MNHKDTKTRSKQGFVIKMKGMRDTALQRGVLNVARMTPGLLNLVTKTEMWTVVYLREATVFGTREEAQTVIDDGRLGSAAHCFHVVKHKPAK